MMFPVTRDQRPNDGLVVPFDELGLGLGRSVAAHGGSGRTGGSDAPVSDAGRERSLTLRERYALVSDGAWLVWALTAFTFLIYLTLSLARWNRWDTPSWDLGIFEQAIKGYANLGWPIIDIKGPGFNQLGDHFSPLLAVIAPFYRMFPSPVTLLVVQCVLVAISAVPLTFAARRLLGHWPGLAIGFAYGLSWGIQSAVDVQFHEYALAAPLLAFGLAAALEERWAPACVWIGLLLGVKEDLGLTVAGFGLVLWLWGQRRRGWWLVGSGVGGMALVLGVIVPFFNPQGRYDYWGKLGANDDAGGAAGVASGDGGAAGVASGDGAVWRLWDAVVGLVTPGIKWEMLLLLVVITAFVALRSPLVLMVVPTLLWRFAGSTELYWGTTWHYSIILMPIMFAAAIDAVRILRGSHRPWVRAYARGAPGVMAVVALALCVRFPLGDLVRPATYEQIERSEVAERALAAIPPGSTVASDLGLILELVADHTVFWIGEEQNISPDYVAVDQLEGWGDNPPLDVAAYAEALFPGAIYEVVFEEDGYVIVLRGDATQPS